jgi:glycerol-3-phosphate cytidylyltransferase
VTDAKTSITGITFGAFDLLHAGHCAFLHECRMRCDELIVGLHVDPSIERSTKSKPIQSVYERWYQLSMNRAVTRVVPYETEHDLINALYTLRPSVRFVGGDYADDSAITGMVTCRLLGIDVVRIQRLHDYSTTELRQRCVKRSS